MNWVKIVPCERGSQPPGSMASDPHYHRRLSCFRFRRFDGYEASFCGTTSSCSGRPHRRPRSGCQPPSCKWQLALRPRRYSVASSHWDHRLLKNLDENVYIDLFDEFSHTWTIFREIKSACAWCFELGIFREMEYSISFIFTLCYLKIRKCEQFRKNKNLPPMKNVSWNEFTLWRW